MDLGNTANNEEKMWVLACFHIVCWKVFLYIVTKNKCASNVLH